MLRLAKVSRAEGNYLGEQERNPLKDTRLNVIHLNGVVEF